MSGGHRHAARLWLFSGRYALLGALTMLQDEFRVVAYITCWRGVTETFNR